MNLLRLGEIIIMKEFKNGKILGNNYSQLKATGYEIQVYLDRSFDQNLSASLTISSTKRICIDLGIEVYSEERLNKRLAKLSTISEKLQSLKSNVLLLTEKRRRNIKYAPCFKFKEFLSTAMEEYGYHYAEAKLNNRVYTPYMVEAVYTIADCHDKITLLELMFEGGKDDERSLADFIS